MIIKVENLSKTFLLHTLHEKTIEAFSNVNFSVREGQFLGLLGPSGSGKSSILKCIYRTYTSDIGNIWYESKKLGMIDLSSAVEEEIIYLRRNEIGYVSQFLKVLPRVNTLNVVAEPLLLNEYSLEESIRKASDLLERLHIPSYLFDSFPLTFSGGEQQRVNIARAIIWEPRLLILDEPTASLDKDSEEIVIQLLKELKNRGTTMIGVFHNEKILNEIADEIFRLEKGVKAKNV